jgi:hypothetical protein
VRNLNPLDFIGYIKHCSIFILIFCNSSCFHILINGAKDIFGGNARNNYSNHDARLNYGGPEEGINQDSQDDYYYVVRHFSVDGQRKTNILNSQTEL